MNSVITLCGSSQFYQEIDMVNIMLTTMGHCVFAPAPYRVHELKPSWDEMGKLLTAHRNKIIRSDFILVVDINGYVGKDTEAEIEFAKIRNIGVLYLTKPPAPEDMSGVTTAIYEELKQLVFHK